MLTSGQHKTLDFIRQYIAREGFAPTLTEIAQGLGISSKGSMHKQVQALAEAGYIELLAGRKRGIQLTEELQESANTLPLIGCIAAGQPIEAIPGHDKLDLSPIMGTDRYALIVKGDSMMGIGILDGDTVIIKPCDTARDGQVVVALIDESEATLKRLRHIDNKTIELIPEHLTMQPMCYEAERVRIQGVLAGQLRFYM
ncbi:MAG: transcriptional repressor LexA [Gammaproteobacteria bacterium]|nr:transcriptional repressor LexA [Gammaproteobacteria bacterium]